MLGLLRRFLPGRFARLDELDAIAAELDRLVDATDDPAELRAYGKVIAVLMKRVDLA